MDAPGSQDVVKQSLFARRTPAGDTWEFVVLAGGGCAVLHDGERVTSGGDDEASVQRVLRAFLQSAGCAAAQRVCDDTLPEGPDGTYGRVA